MRRMQEVYNPAVAENSLDHLLREKPEGRCFLVLTPQADEIIARLQCFWAKQDLNDTRFLKQVPKNEMEFMLWKRSVVIISDQPQNGLAASLFGKGASEVEFTLVNPSTP